MAKFKNGDIVAYEGMECTVVGFDEILEEHKVQMPNEEIITVAESLLSSIDDNVEKQETVDEKKLGLGSLLGRRLGSNADNTAEYHKGKKVTVQPDAPETGPDSFFKAAKAKHHASQNKSTKGNTNTVASHASSTPPVDDHHQRTADKASKFASALSNKGSKAADKAVDVETERRAKLARTSRLKFKVKEEIEQGDEQLSEKDQKVVEDKALLDETAAGDTIKAKSSSASGVMSSSMVKNIIQTVSGMGSDEQVSFYNKMMKQYGKGKDWGAPNKAGENKSSVAAKPSNAKSFKVDSTSQLPSVKIAKEDLDEILSGEEGLSEDLKEKMATLFEAAVNLRVHEEVAEIKEQIEADLLEEFEDAVNTITDEVDSYLTHSAEHWIAENAVEIENNLQMQLSESFISGLRDLFAEHYMEVPEEKVDIVSALSERVDELEGELNEQLNTNIELVETLEEHNSEDIFEEVSDGLAMTQVEKLRALTEGLDYDGNDDDYRRKLNVIKEKYFSVKSKQTTLNEEVQLDEDFNEEDTIDPMHRDDRVVRYAEAITRTIKR